MFWIDGQSYPVQSAELVAEIDEESRRIALSLYVECEESETGLALNNLSTPGVQVSGLILRLSEDMRDDLNDLSASDVTVKGETHRIRSVFLRVGPPRDNRVSVELTATCYPFDASTEQATGKERQIRLAGDVDFAVESGRI
jgi:hypothetical protein